MFKLKNSYIKLSGALTVGAITLLGSEAAFAAAAAGSTFSTLASNVTASLSDVPGLLSAICYIFGIILVILGILKMKEHVEKPEQTPIKEAAVRLILGGALFALPVVLAVVKETVDGGDTAVDVGAASLKKVKFSLTD